MKKKYFFELALLLIIIALSSALVLKYYGDLDAYVPDGMKNFGETRSFSSEELSTENLEEEYAMYKKIASEESVTDKSLMILVYHGITAEVNENDVTIENFKKQMFTLKSQGYETITLEELRAFLNGKEKLPKKSVMITFDDGRKDSYYYTQPVFEYLNYTAVMFAIGRYSADTRSHNYYLDPDELREMEASGVWEIQAHSYEGHNTMITGPNDLRGSFFGNKKWIEAEEKYESDGEYAWRIREDLNKSIKVLERELGHDVYAFAIPFSDYGQYRSNFERANEINKASYKELFEMVFFQFKPVRDRDYKGNYNIEEEYNQSDFLFIMRNTVEPWMDEKNVFEMLESGEEITLPYVEDFSNKMRWVAPWGNIETNENTLVIKHSEITPSSLVYLDGTYALRDYEYKVESSSNTYKQFSLIVRFQNVKHYAQCIYSSDEIKYEVIYEDEVIYSQSVALPEGAFTTTNVYEAHVKGNNVKCYLNNESYYDVISYEIPVHGGVGVRSWSDTNNSYESIELLSVEINEAK